MCQLAEAENSEEDKHKKEAKTGDKPSLLAQRQPNQRKFL